MGLFLTFLIPKGILAKRPVFVDVTRKSGIDFKHTNGKSQRYFIVETLGSGVAAFDYDNDGIHEGTLCNLENGNYGYVHTITGEFDNWSGWGMVSSTS